MRILVVDPLDKKEGAGLRGYMSKGGFLGVMPHLGAT